MAHRARDPIDLGTSRGPGRRSTMTNHGRVGPQPDIRVGPRPTTCAATAATTRPPGLRATQDGAKNAEHRNGSFWHGRGALALGLRPDLHVAAGKFESLLAGHVIGTGIRLGRKRDGAHEHRPGLDITFSAPKSVSLAALLPTRRYPHGDRGVVHAHDEAVRATLDWIEGNLLETRGWDPATRKRPRIKAPHMVAATFRHVASRNLDPQLHTHAVIANMTRDPQGRWRSIEATLLHPPCPADRRLLPQRAVAPADGTGLRRPSRHGGTDAEFRDRGLRPEAEGRVLDAAERDPDLHGREGLGP